MHSLNHFNILPIRSRSVNCFYLKSQILVLFVLMSVFLNAMKLFKFNRIVKFIRHLQVVISIQLFTVNVGLGSVIKSA